MHMMGEQIMKECSSCPHQAQSVGPLQQWPMICLDKEVQKTKIAASVYEYQPGSGNVHLPRSISLIFAMAGLGLNPSGLYAVPSMVSVNRLAQAKRCTRSRRSRSFVSF